MNQNDRISLLAEIYLFTVAMLIDGAKWIFGEMKDDETNQEEPL